MEKKIHRRELLKVGGGACVVVATGTHSDGESSEEIEAPLGEPLKASAITHGGLRPYEHPRLGVEVTGQISIRYLRFRAPVRVDRLELGRIVYGRHVPAVPCHPAHLIFSVLDTKTHRWKTVREVDLPPDPEMMDESLTQEMGMKEMENHFARILKKPPHVIDLGGVQTDHLRVVCDREHPVWPNHGECNGGERNVPFGILNPLKAFGTLSDQPLAKTDYKPILQVRNFKPSAPDGMTVSDLPGTLLYESDHLAVGFSLRRPVLMHLGWDALGDGQARNNRLFASRRPRLNEKMGGVSGPSLRTLTQDIPSHLWTGEVSVEGARVVYRNLRAVEGLSVEAAFTVEKDHLILELTQECDREIPVVEAEAWRLAWDLTKGITGMAAVPTQRPGRNGDVNLPALWATDGVGCLSCELLDGNSDTARFQVESFRSQNCVTGGFVIGAHPAPGACQVVPAGTHKATFKLALTNLEPEGPQESPPLEDG